MARNINFAQKALDNLSNSDKNKVLSGTRTPYSWLLLLFITLFFIVLTIWGFYGRVTESVTGTGITLLKNGVSPIVSKGDGILTHLNISPGTIVQTDQVIGQIYNSDDMFKLKNIENELSSLKNKLAHTQIKAKNEGLIYDEQIFALEREVLEKQNQKELQNQLFNEHFWLKSRKSGTVIEIFKDAGEYVKVGDKIGLVASDISGGIYLVAYIPVKDGIKVKNGMRAFFSPNVAPFGKYGYIRCVVRDVSSAPVNKEVILQELANESLTDMIAKDSVMIRVILEPIPDINSPSGYSWTSKNGYHSPIKNGVLGTVVINTDYRSPASYLIPALRHLLDDISIIGGE